MTEPDAGRAVVVTGGTRGIGRGIAAAFVGHGDRVLIIGRELDRAQTAAAELSRLGPHPVEGFAADLSSGQGCAQVADAAQRLLGGIDVLCANAGVFPAALLTEMSEADLEHVLDTNVKGTILLVKAALPQLVASAAGRVVLTSSITGPITGLPGWSHYGASKAAQLGFMRSAALELAPSGVTVNAVLPGNIETEGLAELGEDYARTMRANVPLGRLGTVAEIGHACLFLASREAGFITGQPLVVDGGQVLPETMGVVATT